jgi:hypothetical protein
MRAAAAQDACIRSPFDAKQPKASGPGTNRRGGDFSEAADEGDITGLVSISANAYGPRLGEPVIGRERGIRSTIATPNDLSSRGGCLRHAG